MIDIRGKPVEIIISDDRETVWVNTDEGCQFRAQKIPELKIVDNSRKRELKEFVSTSPRAICMFGTAAGGWTGLGFLFYLMGLNSSIGAVIGGITGAISGYFIGRRIEMKRLNKCE